MLARQAGTFSLSDRVAFSDDLLTSEGGTTLQTDGGTCTVTRVTDAATGSGVLLCAATFSLPGRSASSSTVLSPIARPLRVGRPEAGMTHYQSLVVNPHTGTPVKWSAGPGTHPREAMVTYHVLRVTVSAFASGKF